MTKAESLDAGTVSHLLRQVAQLQRQSDQITKLKKESFNIFSILRKEQDEEHLHSAFIAELLDPAGSHQLGHTFLALFLDECGIQVTMDGPIRVEVEKVTPFGRIDIYIDNGTESIAIENKIFASDQPLQLRRYHDYLLSTTRAKTHLLYLTLDGKDSSELTLDTEGREISYHRTSYQSHVLHWLRACQEKAVDHAAVRETVKQYILLVKKLTGQLNDDEMQEDVKDAIKRNFAAAELVSQTIDTVRTEYVVLFLRELCAALTKSLGTDWLVNPGRKTLTQMANTNYASLAIRHPTWPEGVSIDINGRPTIARHRSVYGVVIHKDNPNRTLVSEALQAVDFYRANRRENAWWLCDGTFTDFSVSDTFSKILDDRARLAFVRDKAEMVSELCEACHPHLMHFAAS